MRKMKIGIVCYPTYGGSGVIASELAIHLARKHEIHLISYAPPVRLNMKAHSVFFHKVNVRSYPLFNYTPYTLALASKIVDLIRKKRLELLHVHYAIPHTSSAYLAKKALGKDIKIVTTLHGTDVHLVGLDPSYKPIVEFNMQQSDRLTAVSESLKRQTLEKFNIDREIEVIYNFVDSEKYKRESQNESKEKLICHVSNFRPVKRVLDVVRVFGRVVKKIPCRLCLVGQGPDKSSVQKLVKKLGLKNKVEFLGNMRDTSRILRKSHLFLLPSEQESFGLAALEAMSCEVPVVASRVGGLPEVIRHGIDGYLVEVGDLEEMANCSQQILRNEALRRRLGCEARRRVLGKFTPQRIVPQYESLYQGTLAK